MTDNKNLKIGYIRDTYAEQRLFLNAIPSCEYIGVKSNDLTELSFFEYLNNSERQWSILVNKGDFDLLHCFNSVNYGNAPWVVTFETSVPRLYRKDSAQYAIPTLESPNCLAIVAMSQAALNIHNNQLRHFAPESFDNLSKKTLVLHPPQVILPANMAKFYNISPLKIIFVSNQFFLKGGEAMLDALVEFRKHHPVELTLISRFSLSDNVTMHTDEDNKRMMAFLEKNKNWINCHYGLPNEQVLQLMSESHLGVCMSFAETYGYVVLEMQAAGVPVVTTNIRAFPEINSDEIGYLVDYPFQNGRLPADATRDTVEAITSSLRKQFYQVLESIARDNGFSLSQKAFKARQKIFSNHNPIEYGNSLLKIYSQHR